MADGQIPRNNNRKKRGSNNNKDNNIYCPQCSLPIQILDGDIQYSLNLHMQIHKPLASIDQDIGIQLSRAKLGPNIERGIQSNYFCPECNENIEIDGSDIKGCLELHAQKHKRSNTGARGDDKSSTSSGRSSNRTQNQSNTKPEGINALDNIFNQMQPMLKAHRGFFSENETGECICALCNLKIDSLNKISDHLVTKSHEDNTILFIKSKLPKELHETMDFISFYGSNLCCNLCRCKIDLSSLNLSQTIVNIIVHNSGKQHVKKIQRNKPLDPSEECLKKLNFLASKDSLISENKHLITCEMQPQFKCKICDKLILFDQNNETLLKNFTSHFSSKGHMKCVRATSVLTTFKNTNQPKEDKHNLVVTKGSIYCTVCNISMEPSPESLDAHVKELNQINKMDVKGSQQFFNIRDQITKIEDTKSPNVKALLNCMQSEYRNVDYIVENSQGQLTCLICNCAIPSTFYNLQTHLTGNSHMKKLSSTKEEQINGSTTSLTKSQNFNSLMKENSSTKVNVTNETESGTDVILDYLKKNDSLIRKNVFLLTKHDNDIYSCNLCKMTLPKLHDLELFKQNLIAHFSGSKHLKLADQILDLEIKKLATVDPLVRANKQYLRKLGDSLLCTLCVSPLSVSIDGAKLYKSLTNHLKGQQHLKKVENIMSNQETTKPIPFWPNSIGCLKDQYHFGNASKFADNAETSSNMFNTPVEMFKESHDLSKSKASTKKSQTPISLLPNSTEPLREQSVNVKPQGISTEPPKLIFPNSMATDPIMELFHKLPASFQSDIVFIKNSSAVEGFLACTLCNTNHINPPYLQRHLEEEKHVEGKIARRPPSAQADIQNSTTTAGMKVMQNVKTLFGFPNK